jgi:DNA-binding LacI/PurR family transcriptional regulator
LVNDITNPFFSLVARAANDAAAERGFEVLIADSRWQSKHELAEIQRMIHARVDGVLACFGYTGRDCHRLLQQNKVPSLALDVISRDYEGSYVVNDVPAAAHLGINHLVEIGCKKIVFFNASADIKEFVAFQILEQEFRATLRMHGQNPSSDQVVYAGMTIDSGRKAMENLLKDSPDVDGLFCANTLCAMGAMEVAQKMGIKIGRDLAVVGIDDIDICDLDSISLTAVRQPYQKLAEVATNLLIDCIHDRGMPDLRMAMKPELIVRNSTRRKS